MEIQNKTDWKKTLWKWREIDENMWIRNQNEDEDTWEEEYGKVIALEPSDGRWLVTVASYSKGAEDYTIEIDPEDICEFYFEKEADARKFAKFLMRKMKWY